MSISGDRRVWTAQEDDAIKQLVMKCGTRSWSVIAERILADCGIDGRTGKQCRERWHNHLDPHINKDAWTSEEEKIMAEAHKTLGKQNSYRLNERTKLVHQGTSGQRLLSCCPVERTTTSKITGTLSCDAT